MCSCNKKKLPIETFVSGSREENFESSASPHNIKTDASLSTGMIIVISLVFGIAIVIWILYISTYFTKTPKDRYKLFSPTQKSLPVLPFGRVED